MRFIPLVLVFALLGGEVMAYEEASYELVAEREAYEIRRYAPYLVAETTVEGSFRSSGNTAFRRLFRYISGENRATESIAMTVPVTSKTEDGEKIEMTTPVVSTAPGSDDDAPESYVYQFVMPARYTLETLPTPIDDEVTIREIPAKRVAVHRFSGFWSEGNFSHAEETLLDALRADGVETRGEPLYARYNGPFTPWFWRRNEVLITID